MPMYIPEMLLIQKKSIETLVDNIVSQIRENQLTTDIVRGVLHSNLLYALTNTVGLDLALTTVTAIVDRLVNELPGGSGGFDGLGYILNPWTTASNADLVFASMTESVNFNLASCTAHIRLMSNGMIYRLSRTDTIMALYLLHVLAVQSRFHSSEHSNQRNMGCDVCF